MVWNWQLPDWPKFTYDPLRIAELEYKFRQSAGGMFAVLKHLDEEKRKHFVVAILCAEAITSSEIEGEILEHRSLRSSICRHFGIGDEKLATSSKEEGMGKLIWNVYDTFEVPLSDKMVCEWHSNLMGSNQKISDVGKYRSHEDPMQIVAGRHDTHTVHYEAPPSVKVQKEMSRFIKWFNSSRKSMAALERAAVTHIYFESIHPFEDGNGRIGRALVEKALSQSLDQSTLIAISQVITRRRKEYYNALATCNRSLNINAWMEFFAEVIIEAAESSLEMVHFLLAKSRMLNRLKGAINDRQEKALLRMFKEGPGGFSGGLSAENYLAITKTSRTTATRDLNDLVEKGALTKSGKLRHTRYQLNLE